MVPGVSAFITLITVNTFKAIEQQQAGLAVERWPSASDTFSARHYGGTRKVDQKLGFQTNGVVAG